METALITGAGGFCARHLARRLAAEGGLRLVGLDLHATLPVGIPLDDYVGVDLTDYAATTATIERLRPHLVFHLAGRFAGDPVEVYHSNVMGGIHLLDALRRVVPDARVVVVGSAAEYGHPVGDGPIGEDHPCRPQGPYGLSKYAMTLAALDYVLNHGMKIVVVRPFNLIGPGVPASLIVGTVVRQLSDALTAGSNPMLLLGNLESERDFVAVEEVADAYLRLARAQYWGQIFNLCSGQARSVRSVVERLISFCQRPVHVRVDAARVRLGEVQRIVGSWHKANRCIGFQPSANIDDALRSAWEYANASRDNTLTAQDPHFTA